MTEFRTIPEYINYSDEDTDNNKNTRRYTGEARDNVHGLSIVVHEARDGSRASGGLYSGATGCIATRSGGSWLAVWFHLAALRESMIDHLNQ